MAECILQREGAGRFAAHSAGSKPQGRVHPLALDLLRRRQFDVGALRSKSWDEFAAPQAPQLDFIFTVCDNAANEICPVWPGKPISAHWGISDPAAAEGTPAEMARAFDDAYRLLTNRIRNFVSLPIQSLDALALKQSLKEIGRPRD